VASLRRVQVQGPEQLAMLSPHTLLSAVLQLASATQAPQLAAIVTHTSRQRRGSVRHTPDFIIVLSRFVTKGAVSWSPDPALPAAARAPPRFAAPWPLVPALFVDGDGEPALAAPAVVIVVIVGGGIVAASCTGVTGGWFDVVLASGPCVDGVDPASLGEVDACAMAPASDSEREASGPSSSPGFPD
jgi:hypothetical protein